MGTLASADVAISRAQVGPRLSAATLVGALVVFVGAAAIGYLGYTRYAAGQAAPAIAGTPAKVRRGTVAATVSATGPVVASRQSKLTMQVGGTIKEIPVKLGDSVKSGDVIARIDKGPLELKVSGAESSLRTAQIKLEQLKAGARPEEIVQAEATLRTAEAKLSDVQAGPTREELAQAQASVDSSAAAVRSAQSKLDQLRQGASAGDLAGAEQALANARSNLDKAQIALAIVQAGAKPEEIRQQELAVEQARNALWSQQLARDATCSRTGGSCDSARASVAASESSLTQANEKLRNLKQPADPRDVALKQADVESSQEAVRAAQVKLDQLKGGPTTEELRQAELAVQSAQANAHGAIAKLDALKLGARAADLEAARGSVVQAQQALAVKRAPTTTFELQLAAETVKQAELTLRQAQLDLERTTLVAPFDGVVGTITANPGEQIGEATILLTLVDPTQIRVDVTVDESDITKVAPGKNVNISFDALPDKRQTGKVIGVAPNATVSQGVATYQVSVSIDNRDRAIPVGVTANVAIVTEQKENALLVPNRSLKRQGRSQAVDVLLADGKTETRPVTTGLANDQVTEVIRGVAEGETVVIPQTTSAQVRMPGFGGPAPGTKFVVTK